MNAPVEREVKPGCPLRDEDRRLRGRLPPALQLGVLHRGAVEGQGIGIGRAWRGQSSEQPIPLTSKPKIERKLGYSSSPSRSRRSQAPARRQRRRHQDWIRARGSGRRRAVG